MGPLAQNRPERRGAIQSGQSLVEFALIFPLVLLLIFGVIESMHLLLFYTSTQMAAEEATRYGITVGVNELGTPHYLDCAGIQGIAERIVRLGFPVDYTVTVGYDDGPNATHKISCPPPTENLPFGTRIVVEVQATYQPWLPLFPQKTIRVRAESRRTIAKNLPVDNGSGGGSGSSGGGSYGGGGGTAATATPSATPTPTDTPTATPTPTPTASPTATPTPATIHGSCFVEYRRGTAWGWPTPTHNQAQVTIVSHLPQTLRDWSLSWVFPNDQTITYMWQAHDSQSGHNVTATAYSWNNSIASEGSVDFGFQYTYPGGVDEAPTGFVLRGTLADGTPWEGNCTYSAP